MSGSRWPFGGAGWVRVAQSAWDGHHVGRFLGRFGWSGLQLGGSLVPLSAPVATGRRQKAAMGDRMV